MKPLVTFGALLLSLISASAAETALPTDLELAQWQRIADRLRVERGVTNFTWFTNQPLLRATIVHPSFGLYWDEVPPPTLAGLSAKASVSAFAATNGWNMHTGTLGSFSFVKTRPTIRGLPWQVIREREFPAVTHEGILYVIFTGWHHNYRGVAYNPKTNVFPQSIHGFKPLRDGWYVWAQGDDMPSLPRQYERQSR